MASGRLGLVGVPVLCHVEEVPDREQGTAPTLCPSMEEGNAKGVMSRVIFATVTLAQVSVGNSQRYTFIKFHYDCNSLKLQYSVTWFFNLWFRMSECCKVAVMSV